ncbi:hypothetical protein NVP1216O_45 [Vibrio phage 1.216.O._10N.222.55.C12]|nr:hypothetical protein NVP1216O_45 [Vibrio phage 1.216.O._10N.222.55.C12]
MAQVTNKQNMTIAIREYQDNQGQTKKVWKTIGEITTWDDGSQSFEVWGPTGSTQGQVFDKQDNNQQQAPQQNQGYQNAPQQQQQYQQPQQGYQQPQQGKPPF